MPRVVAVAGLGARDSAVRQLAVVVVVASFNCVVAVSFSWDCRRGAIGTFELSHGIAESERRELNKALRCGLYNRRRYLAFRMITCTLVAPQVLES